MTEDGIHGILIVLGILAVISLPCLILFENYSYYANADTEQHIIIDKWKEYNEFEGLTYQCKIENNDTYYMNYFDYDHSMINTSYSMKIRFTRQSNTKYNKTIEIINEKWR